MKTRNFSFDLPEELIAQHPPEKRGTSRLLVLDRHDGTITHSSMSDIHRYIAPGSTMVFNDSKVRKARLFARSKHGGTVELLLLKTSDGVTWETLTSKARRQRIGKELNLPGGVRGVVTGTRDELRIIRFSREITDEWLDMYGHVPLPPYIQRPDDTVDAARYQTVYAGRTGSVAAPTAGLHFTEELMTGLRQNGVNLQFITLHVGAGTFFPIRSEDIEDHRMHVEEFEISKSCAANLNRALADGRDIIGVGTTSVRCLESAVVDGKVKAGRGSTDLYIRPGYRFAAVKRLVTNFHTPGSTLLVLVSAFAGTDLIRSAYAEAVKERYRFFSYGDAMLII
jgi:S-adenosylmethionine:tRNA ribosyltransferase-isomerase